MEGALLMMLVLAIVVAASLALALLWRDAELARLARVLDERDVAPNGRLTLRVRSKGLVALVRAVNGELDRDRERAVAAEAEHAAFQRDLASLSHDIRTPLAGAQGYLQLAQRASDADARKRYAQQAIERLDAMRTLVDGLFDYAKASDPELALELVPVPVMPALSETLVSFYPEFSARGWEPALVCADEDADACALADADALARVFTNLVANALRYGSGAPAIEVAVESDMGAEATSGAGRARAVGLAGTNGPAPGATGDATVRALGTARRPALAASDRPSICAPAEWLVMRFSNAVEHPERIDARRLFDRFYKSDAARAGEGSGLGLAIVARLVEAMGGSASARIEGERLIIEIRVRGV